MILSNLSGKDSLAACPAAIRRVLEWLRTADIPALKAGRMDLEGDNVYALVQDVVTRPFEGSLPEVHEKYIDVMYWPAGGECIGVASVTGGEPVAEARPEDDIAFLSAVDNERFIRTAPGDFCVLFPWDAHRPNLHPDGEPVAYRKMVVKVAMSLL